MFILTILFAVVTLIGLIAIAASTEKEGPAAFASVAGLLTIVFFVISVITIVPTREIGVVTSFGRPIEALPNGIHTKAPWHKVHKLDGTIQTDNHVGPRTRDLEDDTCTDIRLGNESKACVDNTIRWRIKPQAATRLYQDYREMDNIRDSLVTRELKAALNEVLGDYNPLEQIKANDKGAPDLNQFSREVTVEMRKLVGDDVEIKSVILPIIRFDRQTQKKLNSYQAEVANTRIAEQKEQTAKAQAKANAALRESVSNEPNVLVARCLDSLDEMIDKRIKPPIGFSCWPGGSAASVVIPAR